MFRERLQAIRFCTLDRPFSECIRLRDVNLVLPSTVSPPYASTRALSDVARSKTSSSILLLGTQKGDQNQVGESGRELGDESLVDKIYCKPSTRTAATIIAIQPSASDRMQIFETKGSPPLYATSRVPQAYTAYYTICRTQKKCNGTFSSRFSPTSHLPEQTRIFAPSSGGLAGIQPRIPVRIERHRSGRGLILRRKAVGVVSRM